MTADLERRSGPSSPSAGGPGLEKWLELAKRPLVGWAVFLAAFAVLVAVWDLARKALVIGTISDAPLVLAAIGFALLYRLTGLINVAYAETITVGAYLGMWINTTFGLNFYLTLLPTAVLTGLFSVVTYFAIFRPAKLRNVGVVEAIIISFGLSIFLRYGIQFIFGFPFRYYRVPVPRSIKVLGVGVSPFRLIALITAVSLALLLYWFIKKTRLGVQIRALSANESLAQVSGINPLTTTVLIWFIAGMAGGTAGAFYGVNTSCRAWLGWEQFLFIFLVVLLAGKKGLGGVIVAGLGFGVVLSFFELMPGTNTSPAYAQVIVIAMFMVILKVRGRGLSEAGKV